MLTRAQFVQGRAVQYFVAVDHDMHMAHVERVQALPYGCRQHQGQQEQQGQDAQGAAGASHGAWAGPVHAVSPGPSARAVV